MTAAARIRSVLILLAAVVAFAPAAAARSVHGGAGVVTASGRVGALQVNRSGLASVLAFAGQPDAQTVTSRTRRHASYDALGYGCHRRYPGVSAPVGRATWCQTTFYVDVASDSLEQFFTTSGRYHDSHGIVVGMGASAASRRVGHPIHHGCATAIAWGHGHSRLVVGIAARRVALLAVTSTVRDPGALRCL